MKRVVVMGLGRFGGGVAATRYFAARGDDVVVTDLGEESRLAASRRLIEPLGVRVVLGRHDPADFEAADVVVVNPAVPFGAPLVQRARAAGAEIVTEIGLTLRRLRGPVIGVTGTNGKSTTASLCAAMLRESGIAVELGGNIGRSLLNLPLTAETVAVLELSSFQLAWLEHDEWSPACAILTNVTGDHFDRHPDREHYFAAKRRLVDAVPATGLVVLCADDPCCRRCTPRARVAWFGGDHAPPVPLDGLRLAGRHNAANAAAAAHAALAVGATDAGCRAGLAGFEALPHRLELLGEQGGIRFVNDSVSTTPVATEAAVDAFGTRVILLTGGRDKGLSWDPLLRAARRARAVVAYGETGPEISQACPAAHLRPGFDQAVRLALDLAQPGDTVLLSPGFASYDEFPGFDARGNRFRELVG